MEVNTAFQRALKFDHLNGYANAMYGYWLISYERNLDDGVAHFERALKTDVERAWVRRLQMNSLAEESYRQYRGKPDKLVRYMEVLLHAANEMRKNDEPLPANRTRHNIIDSYRKSFAETNVEFLIPLLPPEGHLATVIWLLAVDDKSQNLRRNLHTRYLIARLTEEVGDKDSALEQYREISKVRSGAEEFHDLFDAAIERITGEPTERALLRAARHYRKDVLGEKDDPWEFHRDSLLHVPPASYSENLAQAIDYFTPRKLSNVTREKAEEELLIFIQSRDRIRQWLIGKTRDLQQYGYTSGYSKSHEMMAYNNLHSIWSGVGYMAIVAGQYDKAIAESNDLVNRLEHDNVNEDVDDYYLKRRLNAWSQLARAYSLRAEKSPDKVEKKEDILLAIKYLTKTVKSGAIDHGILDWESIKASSDWQALRSMSEYQSLIRGR